MADTTLQVRASTSSSEGVVLAVEGYLDETGGMALARETRSAPVSEKRRIRIDLGDVNLFNCSGVRQLITLINDLDESGHHVDLVGVRPPLRRLLDLTG